MPDARLLLGAPGTKHKRLRKEPKRVKKSQNGSKQRRLREEPGTGTGGAASLQPRAPRHPHHTPHPRAAEAPGAGSPWGGGGLTPPGPVAGEQQGFVPTPPRTLLVLASIPSSRSAKTPQPPLPPCRRARGHNPRAATRPLLPRKAIFPSTAPPEGSVQAPAPFPSGTVFPRGSLKLLPFTPSGSFHGVKGPREAGAGTRHSPALPAAREEPMGLRRRASAPAPHVRGQPPSEPLLPPSPSAGFSRWQPAAAGGEVPGGFT